MSNPNQENQKIALSPRDEELIAAMPSPHRERLRARFEYLVMLDEITPVQWTIIRIANRAVGKNCSPEQLAEEVGELQEALRGKHEDSPVLEWMEISSLAMNAVSQFSETEMWDAFYVWIGRHGKKGDGEND